MSAIQNELISVALNRANALIDYNIHDDIHKQHEFKKQTIQVDKSLTENAKTEAIKILNKTYDRNKIIKNDGTRRICENCEKECLATLYCEYCVQNYLETNFSNWTSGNHDIDNLIQKCQMETLRPNVIVEWIPYNDLRNIKYLTKGGCSEIYTADWIVGSYDEWDSKKQRLKRFGKQKVILKELDDVESANQRWFEEAKSHLTISNKWTQIVKCYGLTQDPLNGNYMLVMYKMITDLRKYLTQNLRLKWKERIKIIYDIILALKVIHKENAIHRDIHSGNILYSNQKWYISDLGFCGPVNKSSKCIYGNLSYIAPEVMSKNKYTFESDIYSFAMLMWEISSGQPPFSNFISNDNYDNYDLAVNIINGMRPEIVPGTPSEYESLMKQCWDANPLKRPNAHILSDKIFEMHQSYYQNISNDQITEEEIEDSNNSRSNYTSSELFTSKLHLFENLPEPRNAIEGEQEAFHSKLYDFDIPYNIKDFNNSNCMSKESNILKKKFS